MDLEGLKTFIFPELVMFMVLEAGILIAYLNCVKEMTKQRFVKLVIVLFACICTRYIHVIAAVILIFICLFYDTGHVTNLLKRRVSIVVLSVFSYLIADTVSIYITKGMLKFNNASYEYALISIIMCIFSYIISYLFQYFIYIKFKEKLLINAIIIGIIIINVIIVLGMNIVLYKLNIQYSKGYQYISIINIMVMITTIMFMVVFIRYMLAKLDAKEKEEELKYLHKYASNIENMYESIRKFRHDFQNVMLSMEGYIRVGDVEGLRKYYKNTIKDVKSNILTTQRNYLSQLFNLKILSLHSLILTKAIMAEMSNLVMDIDVADEISSICMDEIDLVRIVGIILDNAIEESSKYKNGEINMMVIKLRDNQGILIVVRNTCIDEIPSIDQLFEMGYSTKGRERGTGLNTVREILHKYNNTAINVKKTTDVFCFELKVKENLSSEIP